MIAYFGESGFILFDGACPSFGQDEDKAKRIAANLFGDDFQYCDGVILSGYKLTSPSEFLNNLFRRSYKFKYFTYYDEEFEGLFPVLFSPNLKDDIIKCKLLAIQQKHIRFLSGGVYDPKFGVYDQSRSTGLICSMGDTRLINLALEV
jgi:hypothetical protein